jgi:hypothetical protein
MEDAPATAAAMALCRIVTPLGTPEEPLVYMTQARSSGCGGICLAGLSSPNYFSSLYERRRTCGKQSRKFLVSTSAVDVWFTMTNSRLGTSGRTLARLTSSMASTKMARDAVCWREARRPSRPSVSYAVTIVTDYVKAAWATDIQGRLVAP